MRAIKKPTFSGLPPIWRATTGAACRARNKGGAADLEQAPADDRTAERVQQRSDLGRVLGRLKPRERELLWLAYAEGASHKEIAEVLGLRAPSVRLMLFRARQKMLQLLRRSRLAMKTQADASHRPEGSGSI